MMQYYIISADEFYFTGTFRALPRLIAGVSCSGMNHGPSLCTFVVSRLYSTSYIICMSEGYHVIKMIYHKYIITLFGGVMGTFRAKNFDIISDAESFPPAHIPSQILLSGVRL